MMNNKLNKLREKINQIDNQILKLLNQRIEKAIEVGKLKKKEGLPLRAPEREKEIIERLIKKNEENKEKYLPPNLLKDIYSQIIKATLWCQKNIIK